MSQVHFTPDYDYPVAVALGLVHGVINSSVYGHTQLQVTGVDVDVTTLGNVTQPLDAGEALEIVSDDINDFETMRLFVLGPGGLFVGVQDVTLNGTTPVQIPGSISRINQMQCITNFGIVGTVSIQRSGGGTVFYEATPENQSIAFAMFTIPLGYIGLVKLISASILQNSFISPSITMKFKGKNFGQQQWSKFGGIGLNGGATSIGLIENPTPIQLIGPMDVKLTANGDNTGLDVDARMSGQLVQV